MRLHELQHAFARALLTGEGLPPVFRRGPVPVEAALRVHRNTVLGAGVNALRLSCPTVDRLVGEAFFDQAAAAFVRSSPPRVARLSAYGEGFAEFLAGHAPAAALPYLPDVARLDLAIDRAVRTPQGERRFVLEAGVMLALPAGLTVLWLDYPADRIRDALEAGDDAALAGIDLTPRPRPLLVWRSGEASTIAAVSAPAAAFAGALIAGGAADAALTAAIFHAEPEEALAAIQGEIFGGAFCRILKGEQT